MSSRRHFLRNSGWIAGSILTIPTILSSCQSPGRKSTNKGGESELITPIKLPAPGLQLYTVRDAMEADPQGSLAKVASLGFVNMESATYTGSQKFYGMSAAEFSKALSENGLAVPSGHYMLGGPELPGTILNGWEKAVEDATEAGMKYMVCAYLFDHERENIDRYKTHAETFNRAGEICQQAGIQFCYHNHDFEFQPLDGQLPYDILLQNTDPNLVKMELDLYWVTRAGFDPIELFRANAGRIALWHVKDMSAGTDKKFTEVGNGVIDWKNIFAHAEESGMAFYFVEQDETPGSPFDSIRQSIDYLNTNIIG